MSAAQSHAVSSVPPWNGTGLVERACPLCACAAASEAGRRDDGIRFSLCADCGLVYANPAPTEDAARRLYRDDYFGVSPGSDPLYQGYQHYLESQADARDAGRLELRLLRRYEPDLAGKRVLEIGCGAGTLLATLAAEGCPVTGVELNPAVAALARQELGATVFEAPLEDGLPLAAGSFDLLLACSVLEHSARPGRFLDEVSRLAARGALFLVITPRWEAAAAAGADWIGWRGQWDHLSYFSSATLDRAMAARGFDRLLSGAAGPPARLAKVRRRRPGKTMRRALKRVPLLGSAAVRLKRRLFPPQLSALDSERADLLALYRKTGARL